MHLKKKINNRKQNTLNRSCFENKRFEIKTVTKMRDLFLPSHNNARFAGFGLALAKPKRRKTIRKKVFIIKLYR